MRLRKLGFLLQLIGLFSCTSQRIQGVNTSEQIKYVKFLGEYILPYHLIYKNTVVGGLSGIDYNPKEALYYIICDDWSLVNPARFYKAKISVNASGIDSVEFVDVKYFLQSDGKVYPNAKQDPWHTPDPEALRLNARNHTMVWASEGERFMVKDSIVLQHPALRVVDKSGRWIDSFPLPLQEHMQATEKGPRRNATFEGLCFANGFKTLFVNNEDALYEDGNSAGLGDSTAWIRLFQYDVKTKKLVHQWAYQTDPVVRKPIPAAGFKINGVPDILALSKNKILFIERSFSTGNTDCNIRVYEGDLSVATDISQITSLKNNTNFKPIVKKLVLNMDSLHREIGNIEGVTFGPQLPNGHSTLLFVADNNFKANEKTQFLLFEIIP